MSVTLQPVIRLKIHVYFFLVLLLVSVGCSGGGSGEATVSPAVTASTGGMVVPAQAVTDTVSTAITETQAAVSPAVPPLQPGAQVRASAASVRLYVDANQQAAVMNQYAENAFFTVLEPSGDYGQYPVEVGGEGWYRVRAEDGLVGWIPAALLTAQP